MRRRRVGSGAASWRSCNALHTGRSHHLERLASSTCSVHKAGRTFVRTGQVHISLQVAAQGARARLYRLSMKAKTSTETSVAVAIAERLPWSVSSGLIEHCIPTEITVTPMRRRNHVRKRRQRGLRAGEFSLLIQPCFEEGLPRLSPRPCC